MSAKDLTLLNISFRCLASLTSYVWCTKCGMGMLGSVALRALDHCQFAREAVLRTTFE